MKFSQSFREYVYVMVKQIPRGKMATYGQIAHALGKPRWARRVGWVLHQNRDPKIPCHRVVNRNGRVAPNFAFGGAIEQRKKLLAEGVEFRDEMHVDLAK